MTMREFYATLNVLYLKMVQYERHLGENYTEPVFEKIEFARKEIRKVPPWREVENIGMQEMLHLCKVQTTFPKERSIKTIHAYFEKDVRVLDHIIEEVIL